MPAINLGTITIIVNGFTLNNGLPYFQKAIPKAFWERFKKKNIKLRLRPEQGHYAVQCHRLTQHYDALFRAMAANPQLLPAERKQAAIALLRTYGLEPGDGLVQFKAPFGWKGGWNATPHLDEFLDSLTGTELEGDALEALNGSLPVSLTEALSVYLENHEKGHDPSFAAGQRQHWDKLVNLVDDKELESLTRDDARKYVKHRLDTGIKTTSLSREINTIKAIINVAIREIPIKIANPFESLTIPNRKQDAIARDPYTRKEILKIVKAAEALDDERRRIVLVLAVTGARLAEIVGLRRQDVDLENKQIHIREHEGRSLKSENATRSLPLLPLAEQALKTQLSEHTKDQVFPSYATRTETKADSASATLNKWARTIVEGKSMHCFRHTLRDQLRELSCPPDIAKEIGGWSQGQDVSAGYGKGYPLEIKRTWLENAYSWLK